MSEYWSAARVGEEVIPPGEEAQIEELLVILRAIQERRECRQRPVKRTVHPKQHGCVCAELVVEPGLPGDLRYGIFSEPGAFAAVVRFSNAKQRDDRLPDGHGMGIKVVGVGGEKLLEHERTAQTQDFVLIDHPVFFAKGVADFLPLARDFQRLMLGGMFAKIRGALKGALSRDRRYRLLRQAGAKRPHDPLEIQYWSTTPFKFGPGAAKFSLRPQGESAAAKPIPSADRLRLAMAAHLQQGEARFDFLVQVQTNAATMPIEDATSAWNEGESPYRKVARSASPREKI